MNCEQYVNCKQSMRYKTDDNYINCLYYSNYKECMHDVVKFYKEMFELLYKYEKFFALENYKNPLHNINFYEENEFDVLNDTIHVCIERYNIIGNIRTNGLFDENKNKFT